MVSVPQKFYEHDCIHKLDFCISIVDFARFERLGRNANSYINIFIFLYFFNTPLFLLF